MLKLLVHLYRHAEIYTVMLVWIIIPLGYYGWYRFLKRHVILSNGPENHSPARN
jgi:hypothetical protein